MGTSLPSPTGPTGGRRSGSGGLTPSLQDGGQATRSSHRWVVYTTLFLVLLIGSLLARELTWHRAPELQPLLDLANALLALTVGAMALIRHYSEPDAMLLLIGTGFLGTAFLDGYRTVITLAWVSSPLPSEAPARLPWASTASQLLLSLLLLVSWYFWPREARLGQKGHIREQGVYLAVGTLTLASILFLAFVRLPTAFHPQFLFHQPQELVAAAFFGFALIGYLRKGRWRDDSFEHWLVMGLIVEFAGRMFMSFSGRPLDAMGTLAHLLEAVGSLLVLIGLLIDIHQLYRSAENTAKTLALRTEELERSERDLEEQAGRLRRTAERLGASNRELEQFASIAAHDLLEPLRTIRAFGERLTAGSAEQLGERGREYLRRMNDGATRMGALIDGLLAYSRISTRALPYKAVDLTHVANKALSDLEVDGGRVEIGDLPTVHGDPDQLYRMILNLIGNALKFRHPDRPPVVRIYGRELDGDPDSAGPWCEIVVEDDGIGFAPEYAERIFGVFERLHGAGEYEGTGIGLAVCRRIAERHGGGITAEGRPGEGATFTVRLPVNHSPKE